MKFFINNVQVPYKCFQEIEDVLLESTQLLDLTQGKRYFVVSSNITESRKIMLNSLLKEYDKIIVKDKEYMSNKIKINDFKTVTILEKEYEELKKTKEKYELFKMMLGGKNENN